MMRSLSALLVLVVAMVAIREAVGASPAPSTPTSFNGALCIGPVDALVDKFMSAINMQNASDIAALLDDGFEATVSGLDEVQVLNKTSFMGLTNVWFKGNYYVVKTMHFETGTKGAFAWKEAGFWVAPNGTINPWIGKSTVHFLETNSDFSKMISYRIFLPNYQQLNGTKQMAQVGEVFDGMNANDIGPFQSNTADSLLMWHCGCGAAACTTSNKSTLNAEIQQIFATAEYHSMTLDDTYVSANWVVTLYTNLARFQDGSQYVVAGGIGAYELAGDGDFSIVGGSEYRNEWFRGPR